MSSLVENAKAFAEKWHAGQKYGEEFPYTVHLQAVESVLIRFGVQLPSLRCGAWLHDVLEDTQATYEDLTLFFGRTVADMVSAVTEPKGGNRAWRHRQTYPRIRQNQDSRLIKLADRIANVEAGGKLVGMYRKEYAEFKQALYVAERMDVPEETMPLLWLAEKRMWGHLDSLLLIVESEAVHG